jgi:hypothetical protein
LRCLLCFEIRINVPFIVAAAAAARCSFVPFSEKTFFIAPHFHVVADMLVACV